MDFLGARALLVFALCCVVSLQAYSADELSSADLSDSKLSREWAEKGWPFLQHYCGDCHEPNEPQGELDIYQFQSVASVGKESASMQRVLEMVRFGAMPPEDAEQPEEVERKQFSAIADQLLYSVTCDLRPRPGKVTARRLNRAEYNNTVRDLLGLDFQPAENFPSDEVGAGFDNNGDVLSLSPLLMEKYLDAAEQIASRAIVDPETLPKLKIDLPSDQLLIAGDTQVGRFNGRFYRPEGFAWVNLEIPHTGKYRLKYYGGNSSADTQETEIAVLSGEGKLLGSGRLGYYGGGGSSDSFGFSLELGKGKQTLIFAPFNSDDGSGAAVITNGSQPDGKAIADRLDQNVIIAAKAAIADPLTPDQRIDHLTYPHMIRSIRVEGPERIPREAYPESHHRVIKRVASRSGSGWKDVEKSAIESLRPIMTLAFRRSVTDSELERYAGLVRQCTDRGMSYFEGMQTALAAVLVSPNFLFRIEKPDASSRIEKDGSIELTPTQLATRLSYFLWSSMPDAELNRWVDKNDLKEELVSYQVGRMLADARSRSLSDQFAAQWFGLRNLMEHDVDAELFPDFSPALRDAMREETKQLFNHVLQENRPISELLSADYTFVNGALAKHYGLTGVSGDSFRRVSLEGSGRRGLLTHASILTLTSYPRRTSPVQRGKWILENIFGTPPPDPPAGVPTLEESSVSTVSLTLREQMQVHRRNPACAACHRVMDQLGFGLEEFDAVGAFRLASKGEAEQGMDSSGELPGGIHFEGASQLSKILSKTEEVAFARTAIEKLLTFALGRELRPKDRCVVDEILANTRSEHYRLGDLVREVALSRPFRFYDWDAESPTVERLE